MINHYLFDELENSHRDFSYHIQVDTVCSDFSLHTHDFSELFIILSGDAVHRVDDCSYSVNAGDVYVIKNNVVHGFTRVNKLSICNIMIKEDAPSADFPELKNIPGYQALFVLEPYYRKDHQFSSRLHLDYHSLKQAILLVNALNDEYKGKRDGYRLMFLSYLLNLIIFLSRVYTQGKNASNEKLLSIANAVAYMETNCSHPIMLDELAKMSGMSARNFDRIFKQSYGLSPISYLIRLRIDKAALLLKDTDMSITEIALEKGFNDSTYFSRQFKLATGISPRLYRRYSRPQNKKQI